MEMRDILMFTTGAFLGWLMGYTDALGKRHLYLRTQSMCWRNFADWYGLRYEKVGNTADGMTLYTLVR